MGNGFPSGGAVTAASRYLLILGMVFTAIWTAPAIEPSDREAWLLENALVVLFILTLGLSHRNFMFSRVSITLIFLFLRLHEVGAHYTYSEVPLDPGRNT